MIFLRNRLLLLLRLSLGISFFWFGILKLFDASPVQEAITNSFPPAIGESQLFMLLIAVIEILIGLSFLSNRLVKFAATLMIVTTLLITIPIFIAQGFYPRFPVLSIIGEVALRNIVIMSVGLILIAENKEPKKVIEKKEPFI